MSRVLTCAMRNRFLTNGGQICTAHTRLVVQDDLKAPLLSKLKEELEKLPYCDDPITEKDRGDRAWESGMTDVVQPLVCKSQHRKVLGFLNDAKAAGVTVLTGGSAPDRPGYFIQPTVFVDAAQDSDGKLCHSLRCSWTGVADRLLSWLEQCGRKKCSGLFSRSVHFQLRPMPLRKPTAPHLVSHQR